MPRKPADSAIDGSSANNGAGQPADNSADQPDDDGSDQPDDSADRSAGEPLRHKETASWLRRQRLERQLHDGASLRISALSLRIGLLRYQEPGDETTWRERIGELQDELHAVLQELRDVANKIYPPLLDEAGLGPALRELAGQRGVEIEIEANSDRYGVAAEGAAYFGLAECLSVWPADAAPLVVVRVGREHRELMLTIQGLAGKHTDVMLDQVRPLGGTVEHSDTDSDTLETGTITVRIPCE